MFKPGCIRKVRVKNFVTFSYTELIPGPNLNMLIGPNGTGKSTMVAAIILGLGGNPKVVGRGSKVSEYVKHNCQEAVIDIYFQGMRENEYIHITRTFDTQERNSWKLNGRKVQLKDINQCTKEFNIQVNNLCQFLPQDRVQDFAKLNKKELLRETQIALCRTDLVEKQNTLIECRTKHKQVSKAIDQASEQLQEAQDANMRLEGKVTSFNTKKKYLDEVADIERKMSWVQYEKLREKLTEKKEDKLKATQIYEKHKNAAKPLEKNIADAKKRISQFQGVGSNLTEAIKRAKADVRQKLEKSNTLRRSIGDIISRMDTKLAEITQSEQEIEETSKKVEEMKKTQRKLLDSCGNDEVVRAKVNKITEELRKLSNVLQTYDAKKETVVEDRQNYFAQLRAKQNELNRLQNIKQQRLEKLRKLDNNVYEAVLWLRDNRQLFKGEVFEPMMLEINVLEAKNSIYVENVIARRDYMAFTCVEKDDMNLLIRHLREQKGLRINVLHSGHQSDQRHSFQPNTPIEQLRRFGFYTYVNSLFTAPDPIMHFLCKSYGIHNIPVGDSTVNKCYEQLPKNIRTFFSDRFRFSVNYSKYSGEKSTRQNVIHSDGNMSLSVDVFQLQNLEGHINDLKKSCESCDKDLQAYDAQIAKVNESVSALRGELSGIQQIKQACEQIATRIRTMQRRNSEMRSNIENRENIKQETNRKIQKVLKDVEEAQRAIAEAFRHFSALLPELSLASLTVDFAYRWVSVLEGRAVDRLQACREAEAMLGRVREEHEAALAGAKAALRKAKGLSAGHTPDDDAFDRFRQAYEALPADLRRLQLEKDRLRARIDCLNTADDEEMREYERRGQLIDGLRADICKLDGEMHQVVARMDALQEEWLAPLAQLVAQINYRFSTWFERMGCAGEVSIDRGENERDYADYGLSIKVTFRNGEPLQQLDAIVQSGGERAVATAVFMLSLQELTPVPFRCVDEINQGMDANNERRIFELLVSCTTHPDTAQYFLITPKLVPNLAYGRGMMIHIIHNGPFIAQDRKWMNSRVCNPQMVQIN